MHDMSRRDRADATHHESPYFLYEGLPQLPSSAREIQFARSGRAKTSHRLLNLPSVNFSCRTQMKIDYGEVLSPTKKLPSRPLSLMTRSVDEVL